jgi:hypothetical protein
VGYLIDASEQNPVTIYQPAQDEPQRQASVTGRVRVYRPRDSVQGLVPVRILTGALAGTAWFVRRDNLIADGNRYVQTQEELDNLARSMSLERFRDSQNVVRPIPFANPAEECWARAHLMAVLLAAAGYRVSKILLIDDGVLRPHTIFGDDPVNLEERTAVRWWYHIAPVVFLGDVTHPYVLDPSLLTGAGTPDQWVARMTTAAVEPISYAVMQQRLANDPRWPESPGERPWLVSVPPTIAFPPLLEALDETPETDEVSVTEALTRAYESVPLRRAVAALNILMHNWRLAVRADGTRRDAAVPYPSYPTDLTQARAEFGGLRGWERRRLVKDYPNLMVDVWGTFVGSGIEADIGSLFPDPSRNQEVRQ